MYCPTWTVHIAILDIYCPAYISPRRSTRRIHISAAERAPARLVAVSAAKRVGNHHFCNRPFSVFLHGGALAPAILVLTRCFPAAERLLRLVHSSTPERFGTSVFTRGGADAPA